MTANATPRVICEMDEMRALPSGSVVIAGSHPGLVVACKPRRSAFPFAIPGFWEKVGSELGTSDEDMLDEFGSVTLVYSP